VEAAGVVRRVRGRRGQVTVLDGVDIQLTAGSITGLVGPSLSGKTTLVGLLAGWEAPDEGSITWAGGAAPGWAELTVIPQGFAVLDELTVRENVLLAQRVGGVEVAPDRVASVCSTLGITSLLDRFVNEISVGERQRTMAARALVGAPACVLADEPVAHQDERHARSVLQLLRAAADAGAACLIATRNPSQLDGIADTIVALGATNPLIDPDAGR
jgi:putative ABC transport system ATP-binding protein